MGALHSLEADPFRNQAVDHSPPTNKPTRMLSWIGYGIGGLYIHLHSISVVATRQKTNSRTQKKCFLNGRATRKHLLS